VLEARLFIGESRSEPQGALSMLAVVGSYWTETAHLGS